MHRNKLLQLLNNYHPTDAHEIVSREKMVAFIKENPRCFERSLESGHITASCWLLNKDGSKALMMHHTKLNMWLQLGGHCDGDSDVLAVALKEAQEESGIMNIEPVYTNLFDIDVHELPASKHNPAHFHYDVRFLLRVTSDEDVIQNNESQELRWIDKDFDKLPSKHPSIVRMFNKWVQATQVALPHQKPEVLGSFS